MPPSYKYTHIDHKTLINPLAFNQVNTVISMAGTLIP